MPAHDVPAICHLAYYFQVYSIMGMDNGFSGCKAGKIYSADMGTRVCGAQKYLLMIANKIAGLVGSGDQELSGLVECVKGGQNNFDANWDAIISELEANGLRETEQKMTEFLADKIK